MKDRDIYFLPAISFFFFLLFLEGIMRVLLYKTLEYKGKVAATAADELGLYFQY